MTDKTAKNKAALASAKHTLALEIAALETLRKTLDKQFSHAVEHLAACEGRVIVVGMGKSGHIARKLAATFASTGTPAQFVHAAEAGHGDLGMITKQDVMLVLSRSGESGELHDLINYAGRFSVFLIAATAGLESSLARAANLVLPLPDAPEAGPIGLAPTSSTTMQLALGDALAIALLERKGFTRDHFHAFHPQGALGARLKTLGGFMHKGTALPLCQLGQTMGDALIKMSAKGFGCVGVVDKQGKLAGVITDGDLRRHMGGELLSQKVEAVMTNNPICAEEDMLASAALALMEQRKITSLFIVRRRKPCGIVHIHDFLRQKLV